MGVGALGKLVVTDGRYGTLTSILEMDAWPLSSSMFLLGSRGCGQLSRHHEHVLSHCKPCWAARFTTRLKSDSHHVHSIQDSAAAHRVVKSLP